MPTNELVTPLPVPALDASRRWLLAQSALLGLGALLLYWTFERTDLDRRQAHALFDAELAAGLSPRAGLGLLSVARAWALMQGRDHVLPEDVQGLFPHLAGHRLHLAGDGRPVPVATLVRVLHAVALP